MLKNTLLVGGLCVSCLITALPVSAQEPATLVLRSGDRVSGELVDLGGVGFTIRVNGQDRQVDPGQVSAVEFGSAPGAALQRARQSADAGRPHVVLRSGEVLEGSLFDIGGTHPLRITVQTPGGQRDFTSNDIAQIYYANGNAAVATTGQTPSVEAPASHIRVEANRDWTDTGIAVRRGERLVLAPNGNINLGPGLSAGVNGTTATSGNYPVKSASAGTLIGRVGNGAPFVIGSQTEVMIPANGRLFLGINDDNFGDNNGFFTVGVSRQAVIRRR